MVIFSRSTLFIVLALASTPQPVYNKVCYSTVLDITRMTTGPEIIKLFSCSTQLRLKFILLLNVKMPTIVGILSFMSRIN